MPAKDKSKLREVFEHYDIQCVINLARLRGRDMLDEDYVARRNAVDFGLPLFNNANTALMFVEALSKQVRRRAHLKTLNGAADVRFDRLRGRSAATLRQSLVIIRSVAESSVHRLTRCAVGGHP